MKVIESVNSNLPRVIVTEAAMRSVGSDINVDLDGLNELLRTDLNLKSPDRPSFVLYGRSRHPYTKGFHLPFTNTGYVQIPATAKMTKLNDYSIRRGITQVLVHESSHLVDSMDRKTRTLGETAVRMGWNMGTVFGGVETAQAVGGIGGDAIGFAVVGLASRLFYDYLDQGENRARDIHHDDALVDKYKNVIQLVDCPLS